MGFLDRLRGIPNEVPRPGGTRGSDGPTDPARSDVILGELPIPNARVKAAVADGQFITAVKEYRKQANVGLAKAKYVVDALARGDRLVGGRASDPAPEPAVVLAEANADTEIDRLIRAGRKIEAIKAHRAAYGTGLKESKDAVEARWDLLARG